MNPVRLIYDDTPDFIPIPQSMRHRKTEIIVWPLLKTYENLTGLYTPSLPWP